MEPMLAYSDRGLSMSQKPAEALAYALLIWFVGFAWGTVVFMTPALKNISPIPYVSRYPASLCTKSKRSSRRNRIRTPTCRGSDRPEGQPEIAPILNGTEHKR